MCVTVVTLSVTLTFSPTVSDCDSLEHLFSSLRCQVFKREAALALLTGPEQELSYSIATALESHSRASLQLILGELYPIHQCTVSHPPMHSVTSTNTECRVLSTVCEAPRERHSERHRERGNERDAGRYRH